MTHREKYYSATKKTKILPFVDNMDVSRGHHIKWEKDKSHYDITHMWNPTKQQENKWVCKIKHNEDTSLYVN